MGSKVISKQCRFKIAQCFNCGKEGHTRDACRSNITKKSSKSHSQKQIVEESDTSEDEISGLNELQDKSKRPEKALIDVVINKLPVQMEIDTGAAVTVLSQKKCRVKPEPTQKKLRSATGQLMELAGQATVKATVNGVTKDLRLFIAKGDCPPLFGRDWIQAFYGQDWAKRLTKQVNQVKEVSIEALLDKYKDTVFIFGLGEVKELTAQLKVKPETQAKFYKPRSVPYAVKPKLDEALDRMVAEGNLEKVDYSEWATPIACLL